MIIPITGSGGKASGWGGLGSALASAVPFIGNILGGMFGRKGQQETNQLQMQLAREQMRFQERMSSTAYQRAAKDLEAAGLNRILALGSPASSAAGAMAQVQNPELHTARALEKGTASALVGRRLHQELKNLQETAKLTNEQAQRAASEKVIAMHNSNTAYQQSRVAENEADLSDELKQLDRQIYKGVEGQVLRRAQLLATPANAAAQIMRAHYSGYR